MEIYHDERDGVKCVVKSFGDSWTKYYIIPRKLRHILREFIRTYCHESYGGPGRIFTGVPYIQRRKRCIIVRHSGGYDV